MLRLSSVQRFSRLAFSLLFNAVPGTAMLRITVAFIVVTLTGLPVLPAMCHTWCGEDKTTTGSCHDEAVGNGSAVVITERAGCRALVTDYPFIRDDARSVLHTVQYFPTGRSVAALTSTTRRFIPFAPHIPRGVPVPLFVLRV